MYGHGIARNRLDETDVAISTCFEDVFAVEGVVPYMLTGGVIVFVFSQLYLWLTMTSRSINNVTVAGVSTPSTNSRHLTNPIHR